MTSSTVAIFHASFHPTQGNIVDWSAKANDGAFTNARQLCTIVSEYYTDLYLDGVEFCVLPSGLHTVDRDVMCVPPVSLDRSFMTHSHTDTLRMPAIQEFVSSIAAQLRRTDTAAFVSPPWRSYWFPPLARDHGDISPLYRNWPTQFTLARGTEIWIRYQMNYGNPRRRSLKSVGIWTRRGNGADGKKS